MPKELFVPQDTLRPQQEVIPKPTQEIRSANGERLLFTSLLEMPDTAEDREAYALPDIVKHHVSRAPHASETYYLTVRREGWKESIVALIQEFLGTAAGRMICERYAITDIHALSPKQAMHFVLHMVQKLTKYSYGDVLYSRQAIEQRQYGSTRSDQLDAVTLLREGLASFEHEAWDGNGVCRQFADYVQVVFSAVQAMQRGTSLCNTYCTTEVGWGYVERMPSGRVRAEHVVGDQYKVSEPPHAWNAFIQVDDPHTAHAIAVDVTWSEEKEGDLRRIDYTSSRFEPLVHTALQHADPKDAVLLQSITDAYIGRFLQIYSPAATPGGSRMEYYVSRFLSGYPRDASVKMMEIPTIFREYISSSLARLLREPSMSWKRFCVIMQQGETLSADPMRLLEAFLHNHSLNQLMRYQADQGFIAALIEMVSPHPLFALRIERDPEFRALVRDVHPEMLRPFRPHREAADLGELRYLVSQSSVLEKEVSKYLQQKYQRRSLRYIQNEDADEIYTIARTMLLRRRPDAEETIVQRENKWNILRNFHAYWFFVDKKEHGYK